MNIYVRTAPLSFTKGILTIEDVNLPCALGRTGTTATKREGDGGTPIGSWKFRRVYYRTDRVSRPQTRLPVKAINKSDGWCDAPWDPNYNRYVPFPYKASAESLLRDDVLYNIIIVLDHNERPRIQGGGSAIFMHLAKPGYPPTEGCIALYERDLRRLLARITRKSALHIK